MTIEASSRRRSPARPVLAAILALTGTLGACSSGPAPIPQPRPIINFGGARLRPDAERMKLVNDWVIRPQKNIIEDPGFMVETRLAVDEVYPWEDLEFAGPDTVKVRVDPRAADARLVYEIYGHLHLMARMGRQEEWLPEAPTATGFDLERAILARASDAWLLGRTVFDTQPYAPLDELIYATENGYLDAFIFTARPDEFAEARGAWAREKPEQAGAYRDWFVQTFNQEPPGLRGR